MTDTSVPVTARHPPELMVRSTPPPAVLSSAAARLWTRCADSLRIFTLYESRRSHALATAGPRRLTRVLRLNASLLASARSVWETRADLNARSDTGSGPEPRTVRSHVAAEPARTRPLKGSGEIRRTGDSRVSGSFTTDWRVTVCLNARLSWIRVARFSKTCPVATQN